MPPAARNHPAAGSHPAAGTGRAGRSLRAGRMRRAGRTLRAAGTGRAGRAAGSRLAADSRTDPARQGAGTRAGRRQHRPAVRCPLPDRCLAGPGLAVLVRTLARAVALTPPWTPARAEARPGRPDRCTASCLSCHSVHDPVAVTFRRRCANAAGWRQYWHERTTGRSADIRDRGRTAGPGHPNLPRSGSRAGAPGRAVRRSRAARSILPRARARAHAGRTLVMWTLPR